jgi:ParB-like chromosome segregation protein Spo0J
MPSTVTPEMLENLKPLIQIIPIDDIKLNPRNPRTISEKKFKELTKSIESFWQMLLLRPVILNEDKQPLGGNMKTLAAKKAGLTHIPVIIASMISDQQQSEFLIKDNIHFGEWNFDDLANSWNQETLAGWGFSMPSFTALDLEEDHEPTKRKKTESSPAVPGFNIMLRAETELRRQEIITKLEAAGLVSETDFFLI